MDIIELKRICDTSVRNLAKLVEYNMRVELEKVRDVDFVMQDHWADALHYPTIRDDKSVKEYLQFLSNASKAMEDAIVQQVSANIRFDRNDTETSLIAETLMGSIGVEVDEKLAECSREVKKTADRILTKKKRRMTKSACEKLLHEFMDTIIQMTKEYGYCLTNDDSQLELNGLYLEAWFWNKCTTK